MNKIVTKTDIVRTGSVDVENYTEIYSRSCLGNKNDFNVYNMLYNSFRASYCLRLLHPGVLVQRQQQCPRAGRI